MQQLLWACLTARTFLACASPLAPFTLIMLSSPPRHYHTATTPPPRRYLYALTWSIVACQGGIVVDSPTHTAQVSFMIFVMVLGLMIDAVLIGSIAEVSVLGFG